MYIKGTNTKLNEKKNNGKKDKTIAKIHRNSKNRLRQRFKTKYNGKVPI